MDNNINALICQSSSEKYGINIDATAYSSYNFIVINGVFRIFVIIGLVMCALNPIIAYIIHEMPNSMMIVYILILIVMICINIIGFVGFAGLFSALSNYYNITEKMVITRNQAIGKDLVCNIEYAYDGTSNLYYMMGDTVQKGWMQFSLFLIVVAVVLSILTAIRYTLKHHMIAIGTIYL